MEFPVAQAGLRSTRRYSECPFAGPSGRIVAVRVNYRHARSISQRSPRVLQKESRLINIYTSLGMSRSSFGAGSPSAELFTYLTTLPLEAPL